MEPAYHATGRSARRDGSRKAPTFLVGSKCWQCVRRRRAAESSTGFLRFRTSRKTVGASRCRCKSAGPGSAVAGVRRAAAAGPQSLLRHRRRPIPRGSIGLRSCAGATSTGAAAIWGSSPRLAVAGSAVAAGGVDVLQAVSTAKAEIALSFTGLPFLVATSWRRGLRALAPRRHKLTR